MKVIDKITLDTNTKVKELINEKNIMQSLNHPLIVKLHSSFQSKNQLHFIMDFCPGDELFYHLHNIGRLNEEQAKFYFAEVLLATFN
jgi:protein-serine/threonine kinase